MKTVLIGIPVKNCDEWLENVVNHIININYPKQYISIIFLENDSVDNSLDVVKHCCNQLLSIHSYKLISYEKRDMGFHLPHNSRHDFRHMEKRMLSLKTIRNYIVDTYLVDNDYLWWVDADYKYIPENFLINAINNGQYDILMPRVEVNNTNYDGMTYGIYQGEKYSIKKLSELVDVDYYPMEIVECASLISRKVFDAGIRYGYGNLEVNGNIQFLQEGPYFSHLSKIKGFKLGGDLKHIIVHHDICGTDEFNN